MANDRLEEIREHLERGGEKVAFVDDIKFVFTELKNRIATLQKEQKLVELEKQILLGVFQRAHSEMDDDDYLNWYECVVKMVRAFKKGQRGVDVTIEWDEHPKLYEAPCYCKLCRSYGD